MTTLQPRKPKDKKPELTEDQKFTIQLQHEVGEYMTLHKASYFGNVRCLERLFDEHHHKVHADAYDVESGNTPLILAARNGHQKIIEILIEKGKANPNLAGYGGLTALHHACKNDHLEVVQYLIELPKIHINGEDDAGNTPLMMCARMGNFKCMELLANKGASLEHSNKRGCTALMTAVLNCRQAIVDWCLKRPINVSQQDQEGNTALHYAARCGFARIVSILLAAHIKAGLENLEGFKADELAVTDQIRNMIQSYVE